MHNAIVTLLKWYLYKELWICGKTNLRENKYVIMNLWGTTMNEK